jgi:hypothetical protein
LKQDAGDRGNIRADLKNTRKATGVEQDQMAPVAGPRGKENPRFKSLDQAKPEQQNMNHERRKEDVWSNRSSDH